MAGLKEEIAAQQTAALKAGDKVRLGTLRLLGSAIQYAEVEVGHDLSDDEVRDLVVKEAKKRKESIEAYGEAGRQDLVDKESAELAVLEAWLPEQLSDDELNSIIDEAIASTGASGPQEMGKVMGAVMAKAKGKADGKAIQAKVKEKLGSE